MEIRSDDFQSLYRRYAYSLYREVFEELKDIEATREIIHRVFSRIREEGTEGGYGLEERIYAYKLEYVKERKKAQLDVGRVWYQMQNDEILGREGQFGVQHQEEPGSEPIAEPVPELEAVPEQATQLESTVDERVVDIEREERRPRRIREISPEELEEEMPEPVRSVAMQELPAAAEDVLDEDGGLPEEAEPVKKAGGGIWLCWIFLVIAIVLFLWIFVNLLMSQGILPFVDLGYSWFNEHVVTLFPIIVEVVG